MKFGKLNDQTFANQVMTYGYPPGSVKIVPNDGPETDGVHRLTFEVDYAACDQPTIVEAGKAVGE